MEVSEELSSCENLFLLDYGERDEGELEFLVAGGVVSEESHSIEISGTTISDLHSVKVTDQSPHYRVSFLSFIAYAVRDESYAQILRSESFTGEAWRIYTKSLFLEFLSKGTFATDDYPGPFVHYGLVCLNHIIDVASQSPPRIARVPAV